MSGTQFDWRRQVGLGDKDAATDVPPEAERAAHDMLHALDRDWIVVEGAGVWGNYRTDDTGFFPVTDGWNISDDLGRAWKYPDEQFWSGEESMCRYERHPARHFVSAHETSDGVRLDVDPAFRRYFEAVEVQPGVLVSDGEPLVRASLDNEGVVTEVSKVHVEKYLAARGEALVLLHSVNVPSRRSGSLGPMVASGRDFNVSVFGAASMDDLLSLRGKTVLRGRLTAGATTDKTRG